MTGRGVHAAPRVSVIGTGYLGATHAAGMAELGFEVVGVDSDPAKVAALSKGRAPFHEPGLDDLLQRHVASGRLRFTTSIADAAQTADVHFVCVGTPQVATGLAADLSAVLAVTHELADHLEGPAVIVGKSTVPVGTAQLLAAAVAERARPGLDVDVAWNPEFLREGHGVHDTLHPDRLVLGVTSTRAEGLLRGLYATPIAEGTPVHVTDLPTAELAKVAANAFLATKISFINAMAEVSDHAGADVVALADILGDDARIGRRFLDAGLGFGGGCLPKDIRAFSARATDLGAHGVPRLLAEVDAINLRQRTRTVDLARELAGDRLRGRRVTVLGASFKPLSDDVRDSPSLDVAARLHRLGADVRLHDPQALANAARVRPELTCVPDLEEALSGAHVVLHLTEWAEYRALDPARVADLVAVPALVDARNALDLTAWRDAGWTVRGLGRGTPGQAPAALPEAAWLATLAPAARARLRGLLDRS